MGFPRGRGGGRGNFRGGGGRGRGRGGGSYYDAGPPEKVVGKLLLVGRPRPSVVCPFLHVINQVMLMAIIWMKVRSLKITGVLLFAYIFMGLL